MSQTPIARRTRKIAAGVGLASVMAMGGVGVHLATSYDTATASTATTSSATPTATASTTSSSSDNSSFSAVQAVQSGTSSSAQTTTSGS